MTKFRKRKINNKEYDRYDDAVQIFYLSIINELKNEINIKFSNDNLYLLRAIGSLDPENKFLMHF